MLKKIGTLIVTLLGIVLLVYSATRSLDFIMLTLPADRQILAYFGLAALDGGLLAWILVYLYGSLGGWQRGVSILMVLVDTLGAVSMFTLDTLYNTGKSGLTTALKPDELQTAVLALSGIIALNIAATIAHHLTEPEKLREQAEEEAFAKVEDATLKQISLNAESLAAQLAPILADDWMKNSQARYLANLGTGRIPRINTSFQDTTPVSPTSLEKAKNSSPELFSNWSPTIKPVIIENPTTQVIEPAKEVESIKTQPTPFGGNGNGHT